MSDHSTSMRLPQELFELLQQEAKRTGTSVSRVAVHYMIEGLEKGIRMKTPTDKVLQIRTSWEPFDAPKEPS